MMKINDIIKTCKVPHYVKNVAVLIPIMFSMNLTNIPLLCKELMMFIAFCFISSSIYVFNDVLDVEKDKTHPEKSKRPIASGKFSNKEILILFISLFFASIIIAFSLNLHCVFAILAYFVLNVIYSLKLKNIFLIDAVCIALGFIIRVLGGCAAIWVVPSAMVTLLTFFMSMFFTFSKRKLELKSFNNGCRESLSDCNESILNQFIIINAILAISFYFTYILDEKTIVRAGTEYLYVSVIPFTLIFLRMLYLISLNQENCDPMKLIEKDIQLKLFLILFFGILILLLILG